MWTWFQFWLENQCTSWRQLWVSLARWNWILFCFDFTWHLLLIWLRLAPLPSGSRCCPAPWGSASPWSFSPSLSPSITTSSWPIVFITSSTPWGIVIELENFLKGVRISSVQVWITLEHLLFNMGCRFPMLWEIVQFFCRTGGNLKQGVAHSDDH